MSKNYYEMIIICDYAKIEYIEFSTDIALLDANDIVMTAVMLDIISLRDVENVIAAYAISEYEYRKFY